MGIAVTVPQNFTLHWAYLEFAVPSAAAKTSARSVPGYAIPGSKVLADFLLSMIDPAGQDQEQRLPGLRKGFHFSMNAA